MAITVWQEKAERARAALARLREATESAVVHARHDAETVGAAVIAGAVRGAFEASGKTYAIPAPGGMSIPPEVPLGLLLLGIAFSGQSDASADFHAAGSGVLAYSGGREAENYMRARGALKPGEAQ
jgi:hypothetical protein